MKQTAALLRRHAGNPILTAAQWPYPIHTVFNAAATRLADGTTLLLCRVEDFKGHSHLSVARSANGLDGWAIEPEPALVPDSAACAGELWGVEDPRITWLAELEKYAVVYTAYGRGGPAVAVALTRDFRRFERLGVVLPADDKDAALLPRRIDGRWAMVHRPFGREGYGAHMWLSYSPDLRHWGDHRLMLACRNGGWWDANKIGLSPPPIETDAGWLVFYHGVRVTASGSIYRVGLALFDRDDPSVCLRRGPDWIMGPAMPYERRGDVDGVVFPTGVTRGDDGDSLRLYYGAADTCIGLATGRVGELLAWLRDAGQPERPPEPWY